MQRYLLFFQGKLFGHWLISCLFLVLFSHISNGQGRIWYVKEDSSAANTGNSWQTATSFHKALRGTQAGDQVWLAQGTYPQYPRSQQPPPLNNDPAIIEQHKYIARQFFLIPSGVKVYGHFAGDETTLPQRHGSQTLLYGMPLVSHVVAFKNAAQGTLLDGVAFHTQNLATNNFYIEDGLTGIELKELAPGYKTHLVGENVLNYAENGTSRPTLNDCTLDKGVSRNGGGTITNQAYGPTALASLRVLNSTIRNLSGVFNDNAVLNRSFSGGKADLVFYNTYWFNVKTNPDYYLDYGGASSNLIYNTGAGNTCRIINNTFDRGGAEGDGGAGTSLATSSNGATTDIVNCSYLNVTNSYYNIANGIPIVFSNVNLSYSVFHSFEDQLDVPTDPARHLVNISNGIPTLPPCTDLYIDAGDNTILQRWPDLADIPGLAQRVANHIDIGIQEKALVSTAQPRYYVNPAANGANTGTSWQDAFTDLAYALTQRNECGMQELWVAQGTYSTSASFSFQPGIRYYGGFTGTETSLDQRDIQAHPTILSRTAPGAPIVQNQNLTAATRLDGFVIQGGNTTSGGGMSNQNSSPTLANCLFKNNTASGNGGGLYNDETSYPVLLNCSFTANKAAQGGAIYTSSTTSLTIINTQFTSNTAPSGGALFSQSSSPMLTGCVFTQNMATKGGAVYTSNTGSPTFLNSQFIQNVASSQGGALYASGNNISSVLVKLINCTLVGNSASQGGAFYNVLGQSQLTNCSLSSNTAGQGGAIYNLTSPVEMTNSIVWNSGGSNSFANNLGGTVTARFSLFEATVSGYNSVTANLTTTTSPFVSATALQLVLASPAINAGSNVAYSTANGPTTDLGGITRILGGTIDMGAYELPPDLTLLLYARPTTVYKPTAFSVVIDVIELAGVATSGNFTLRITKDTKLTLSLPPSATAVGGRGVQNSAWQLTGDDSNYYVLTTSQPIAGGGSVSVGLTGMLSPGATSGQLSISSTLLATGLVEARQTNNSDADKIEYFQQ